VRRLCRCRRRTSDFGKRSRSAHQVEGSEDECLLLAPPDSRRVVCSRTLVPSCRDSINIWRKTSGSRLPSTPAQEPVVSEIGRFRCSPPNPGSNFAFVQFPSPRCSFRYSMMKEAARVCGRRGRARGFQTLAELFERHSIIGRCRRRPLFRAMG